MSTPRSSFAVSLLSDGRVLVTGGTNSTYGTTKLVTTEIYDPVNNTWTSEANMTTGRMHHQQVTYTDKNGNSMVMVIGGDSGSTNAINSTEIYDPVNNTWTAGKPMAYGRDSFSALLLHDGRILVDGGDSPNDNQSEVYDPTADKWTTYTASYGVITPPMVLLGSGSSYKVLVAWYNEAMVFDPSLNSWSSTNNLNTNQGYYFTLTTLSNGNALAAGGNHGGQLKTTEEYNP